MMNSCKTLKERQLSLLLEIESLVRGTTSTPKPAPADAYVRIPHFHPRPPQSKKRTSIRRRARTAEAIATTEPRAGTPESTPTQTPEPPSKTQRKSATDHLLRVNSDPKIREWLNRKEKEMRLVQREKRREEKQQKREAKAETIKREEQKKFAQEKYIEWSAKKLGIIRKQSKHNEMGKQACERDSPIVDKAFDEWLDKKRKQKKETNCTSPTQAMKSVSEEKKWRYDEWMKSKRNLDRKKAKQKITEEEERQKHEVEEEKCKEEERARRLSYNDWLKKKQEKDQEVAKQRKQQLEKDGQVEELNPFSDVARNLLIKRQMDKEMMKHRVNTGILINRPRVERRLRQPRRLVDATEVLGKYVEQIQLSEIEQENVNTPPLKLAWRHLPERLEPQGCEAPEPASSTLNTGGSLSLLSTHKDCLASKSDSPTLTSTSERNEAHEKAGGDVSGDTSPMTNVM